MVSCAYIKSYTYRNGCLLFDIAWLIWSDSFSLPRFHLAEWFSWTLPQKSCGAQSASANSEKEDFFHFEYYCCSLFSRYTHIFECVKKCYWHCVVRDVIVAVFVQSLLALFCRSFDIHFSYESKRHTYIRVCASHSRNNIIKRALVVVCNYSAMIVLKKRVDRT